VKPLIVDALASGKGVRKTTRDVIGAGPRTVAGILEALGVQTQLISVEDFLEGYKISEYDSLFISGMSSDISAIQRTVRKWRKNGRGIVVIGGPVASEPLRVLERTGGDIAITGEGEYTIEEIIEGGLADGAIPDNVDEIRGISYRIGKKIKVNPLRPVQPKTIFHKYPPSTEKITSYRLHKSARVYVEVVRGCSNFRRARIGEIGEKCTLCEQCTESSLIDRYNCPVGIPPGCGYCSVPSLYGPPKSRPSELIIDEASKLLNLGVHRIVLSAPGFLDYERETLVSPEPLTDPRNPEPNYEKIEQLLKGLTDLPQVKEENASIIIENMKSALVTEKAAEILGKYLKGTAMNIGFETGSEDHSKLLGRPDTPEETLRALKRLKKAGLKPYVYFIHGLPGQTPETVDETIKMINTSVQKGAERVILYRFQSLPASTFSQCPSGPPASQDPLSRKIYDAAQKANSRRKEAIIGETFKVVVAEKYDKDPSYWVTYPILHGPVTLIKGKERREGDVLTVEVSKIASERMVYGKEKVKKY
jgi:radical SAM superfamily enzyme YgiQ (UPF0313 family)